MKKKLIIAFVWMLLIGVFAANLSSVKAISAYKTYTLNRNGRLVETNEAYEAIYMIRTLSDGSQLSGAKDIFVDEDDYIYVADTGNKRIVVMNPELEVCYSFGSDLLVRPLGIAVRDNRIYVADYGRALSNQDIGQIVIYAIDKTETEVEDAISVLSVLSTPSSDILQAEGMIFRPQKIAVDQNHTMYIVNEGTTNGVLMVNQNNRFINYFASNPIDITLWQRLQRIFYQHNENVNLTKNIPVPVTNISLDGRGYFYTVTQTLVERNMGDNVKKVNIGGVNFFSNKMFTYGNTVDSWPGKVGNMYTVTSDGAIVEYDQEGNLLFKFAGKGTGNDKLGLFLSASAIAQDSTGRLFVVDDNQSRNSIQIFRSTPFAEKIHQALDLFNQAKYVESIDVWQDVLRYNSMFDLAYKGIGLGYLMNEQYEEAKTYFEIAYDQENYSEAYWEIRNIYLVNHFEWIFFGVIVIVLLGVVISITNRKYAYLPRVFAPIKRLSQNRYVDELLFMFHFIRHPEDSCYEVKRRNRVSVMTGFLVLLLFVALNVIGMVATGFIFSGIIIEEVILFNEVMKIVLPILIFVIANYLISSLMEGEGTLKATFLSTIGSLMPIFLIYPIVIIMSNFLTLNEQFLYWFPMFVIFLWSGILLFFNIKETHNYSVTQTFVNLFLSLLMMVVIITVLIMVYLMIFQVGAFITDIIKEVIIRE